MGLLFECLLSLSEVKMTSSSRHPIYILKVIVAYIVEKCLFTIRKQEEQQQWPLETTVGVLKYLNIKCVQLYFFSNLATMSQWGCTKSGIHLNCLW